MTDSAAIIGAGITGLTAARQLAKAGIPFVLYESGTRAGGVIRTVQRDGFLAECGPNTILETSPVIKELVHDLGLAGASVYSTPLADKRYIVRNGALVALPANQAQFLSTRAFSLPGKLRLAREIFIPRRAEEPEESIADFVRRRVGREFLDYAINPFVSGIYAGNPEELSVKHAFPKLLALEKKYGSLLKGQFLGAKERKARKEVSKADAPKLSFKNGLQTLIDALVRELRGGIQYEAPLRVMGKTASGWRLQFGGKQPFEREHSTVLLTAPAYALAGIKVENAPISSFGLLDQIKHPPVATYSMGFRREDVGHALDGFGVLVPEVEKLSILGAIFASSVLPGRAPEGHVLITVFMGGCRNPSLAIKPMEELKQVALSDLKKLLNVKGDPVFENAVAYPKAIPQYNIGYGKFLDFFEKAEAAAPGLHFAGNYRGGISLSDSIIGGLQAGGKLAKLHSSPSQ
jgi:oxygen-dependent protoporphyrinogen oxidase